MLDRLMRLFGKHTSLVVLSFPKSGRTWHRVMLGHYLAQLTGAPAEMAMDIRGLRKRAGLGRINYTHNGANFTDSKPCDDPSVADPREWSGKPVFLIVRDPRDVLVSAFHHAKYRKGNYAGDISTFIRLPETGIDKVLTALNRWHGAKGMAAKLEVASYEDMHRDPEAVLRQTLACLSVESDPRMLKAAADFASFEKMKVYEKSNALNDGRMAIPGNDERGAKVRQGKVGGYAAHLSEDDLSYIAQRVDLLGDPFANHYAARAACSAARSMREHSADGQPAL